MEKNSEDWKIIPLEVIIERIKQFPSWWKIGDFGCGKAAIMNEFGDRVFSCDHYAINERVTSCDMRSIPQLSEKSLEIIVYSLSLMGRNWPDYITEARRCLVTNGTLLIADTTHSIKEGRLSNLTGILQKNNFEIYSRYELDYFVALLSWIC